ncbi:MAG: hypothetical protein NC218_00920 [Acetobacter sp.]|nr:hypothetical protein [Acetobacter sp.]
MASCSSSSWEEQSTYEYMNEVSSENGAAVSSSFMMSQPEEAAKVFNKRVPPLDSLIICRDKQCAPAELSKSREYIFNALTQLVDNNLDHTALLCEANPQAHVCTNPYLTVPAKIGVTPAYVYFDGVKLVDASIKNGQSALDLVLGYNLSYNGQTPTVCKPDKAMLYVKNNNKVVLNGNGFKCDMTSVGTTTIRVMFSVDYIDLDYGYIGGYYSIGLSGPAYGGGSGYGLIRLLKDAHPLSPSLMALKPEEIVVIEETATVVKPQVNAEALRLNDEDAEKALAPVEIKEMTEEEPIESYSGRKPLNTETSFDNEGMSFSDSSERIYLDPAYPAELTPDSIVRSDRVILRPDANASKPYEVKDVGFEPTFEEVYVDDLDEYIK